jgi:hypothetical protein
MDERLTADQVRQDYIAKMGDELGSQFNRLHKECAWLHLKWREYVALFGTSQSQLDLLNASARGFFVLLDGSLWSDLLLHLCILTDDPGVGRMQTLTILSRSWSSPPSTTRSGGSSPQQSRKRSSLGTGAIATSPIKISD